MRCMAWSLSTTMMGLIAAHLFLGVESSPGKGSLFHFTLPA